MQEGLLKINDLKNAEKKGLEFDGLKNKGQIVKNISESADVSISDEQHQQTESTPSSPSSIETTSAVRPVISADNYYCYTDLTLRSMHCINFLSV